MEKIPRRRDLKFLTFKASPTVRFIRKFLRSNTPTKPPIVDPPHYSATQVGDPWGQVEPSKPPIVDLPNNLAVTEQETTSEVNSSHFSNSDNDSETLITMQKLEQFESSLNSKYEIIDPSMHPIDFNDSPAEHPDHPSLGLFDIASRMRQAESIETLFEATVTEVRKVLQTDRVLIYRLQGESQGMVVAEAMMVGYTPSLKATLPTIAFGAKHLSDYQQRPFVALNEVVQESVTPYQLQLLERFQVKSSLSIPIWVGEQLWGLLIAQQCSNFRQWEESEINWLDQVTRELRLNLQPVEARAQKHKQMEQDKIIAKMIKKIHQSPDVASVFETTTQEVRQQLKCDRVAVYRFNPDWSGQFVSESVGKNWVALVGLELETAWADSYMQETQGGRYRNNETIAVDDIYNADHSPCHVEILEGFEVKAYTIAPIFDGETLWGLLGAYQNSGTRHWEPAEVSLLAQVGRQFGLAIRQAEYLEQVQSQATELRQESDRGQATAHVIDKLRQTSDIDTIFKTVTQEVRKLLNVERLTIYKFRPDFFGDFVAESEARGLPQLVGSGWEDPYLQEHQGGRFCNNEPLVIDNIYTADLTDCHIEALEVYEVKACLVVSIFQGQTLWGLLSAFQTSAERHWQEGETQLMMRISAQLGVALQQAEYLEQLRIQAEQLAKTAERERFITKTGDRIRQSLDLQKTFKSIAREIRSFWQVDRVAIFKFDPGYIDGSTIVEDVTPGYVSALAIKVTDHCFAEGLAEQYQKGRVWALDDLYQSGMANCYIELLSQFQVQANLVVPLFKGEELWGLFCIHQCSGPRKWQEAEIEFAKQIAAQLNVAIQQGEFVEQLQQRSQQLAEAAQREKSAKEQLQQEVIQLLMAVRPALAGDLTVRAPVTDTEVGTVADAYNNTLGSLRQIVTQMQAAANQVTQTTQTSNASITMLTHQAQEQLQAIDQALGQVQIMASSTEAVETNAQQVEAAVQQANQTVLAGDAAIDRTVEEMEDIRETVMETSKRLQRLSESSQKISRVVNLIGNFTTQTQLLALNASIEATRAGEFGRGFGVVADEVRSLARQSANAATEIEQLVQEIQASTAQVSTAMETGIQQVESGTTVVNEARQNLNAIVDATAQISHLVTGITQATHAQTQECQSVTQTMTKVATIAHKTSKDSSTISASFKALLATAQDLQSKSDQFKVD
ncbi:MAG: GAF domain-containing protein [Leptolyngbyaceae cyanobacterium CSU_1_3]|nr:GAF domain-containing protein [Leptolyngbyaceae cyanobacterium CSU_1_3]